MGPHTYWQWILMGIGGICGMAEQVAMMQVPLTQAQEDDLRKRIAQLAAIHSLVKGKAIDG